VPAFAPVGWYWLAPLCVAGYTLSARAAAASREARGLRRPATAAAWSGFWFGLAFCVLMFQWVTVVGTDAWIVLGIVWVMANPRMRGVKVFHHPEHPESPQSAPPPPEPLEA